jgi:hypothetical protein
MEKLHSCTSISRGIYPTQDRTSFELIRFLGRSIPLEYLIQVAQHVTRRHRVPNSRQRDSPLWLYEPTSVSGDQKLPVIIMSAGWASLKEMSIDLLPTECHNHRVCFIEKITTESTYTTVGSSPRPERELHFARAVKVKSSIL